MLFLAFVRFGETLKLPLISATISTTGSLIQLNSKRRKIFLANFFWLFCRSIFVLILLFTYISFGTCFVFVIGQLREWKPFEYCIVASRPSGYVAIAFKFGIFMCLLTSTKFESQCRRLPLTFLLHARIITFVCSIGIEAIWNYE